jgi:hypothetical protein
MVRCALFRHRLFRLIAEALDAMAQGASGTPLLPKGHPLDLFTTATDYAGHPEKVALHSPPGSKNANIASISAFAHTR